MVETRDKSFRLCYLQMLLL